MTVEEKIYGCHPEKARKVLAAFKDFQRSLGVIMSGAKGIGKSVSAKLIAAEALDDGMPVIICDQYIPGISSFIESIEQEVMILFDEFDKAFAKTNDDDPQASMLSLFDGTAVGKKLYVVTCNYLNGLCAARLRALLGRVLVRRHLRQVAEGGWQRGRGSSVRLPEVG